MTRVRPALVALAASLSAFSGVSLLVWPRGTPQLDLDIMRALRQVDDPGRLVGPDWVALIARVITDVGGIGVLAIVIVTTAVILGVARRWRELALFVPCVVLGLLLEPVLKGFFLRERPAIVPMLVPRPLSLSFPSGHALHAAVVYGAMAGFLGPLVPSRRSLLLVIAALLIVLVGASRVALGVHYPTDVAAGSMAGVAWVLAWSLPLMRPPRSQDSG